jgi:hypothetical protein
MLEQDLRDGIGAFFQKHRRFASQSICSSSLSIRSKSGFVSLVSFAISTRLPSIREASAIWLRE